MAKIFQLTLLFSALVSSFVARAEIIKDTLYINNGIMLSIDSVEIPVKLLNRTDTFQISPAIVEISIADQLDLVIVNNDSIGHQIVFLGGNITDSIEVSANAKQSISLQSNDLNLIRIQDLSETEKYAGINGMILFKSQKNVKTFYWNLREIKTGLTQDFSQLGENYEPEYFTINNRSYPATTDDSIGYMTGHVGDSILLMVYNSGLMHHNLHFHGYHARIEYSSLYPSHKGRLKDSFPVDINEGIVFLIVPHQAGKFPVHNHNLGTTLGNNIYPNGMVGQINISEK